MSEPASQSTMMQIPLSINYCLHRGAQIYGGRRVISRLPDRSVRTTSFAATAQRARQLAAGLKTARSWAASHLPRHQRAWRSPRWFNAVKRAR
jgi:hypothetical protein